jgi:lysophospholipase L1-like esterase
MATSNPRSGQAPSQSNGVKVCVIGHSYVARLRDYVNASQENRNLKLNSDTYSVEFRAQGGLTFSRLSRCPELLNFHSPPDMCFVQMGGNDLCHRDPETVCRDIISYAQYLKDGVGVRNVVVGQLLRRREWASRPDYNKDVITVNKILKERTQELEGIHFWSHRGFWADLSHLGRDGVHLNTSTTHMKKYLHSIRIAVRHHSR